MFKSTRERQIAISLEDVEPSHLARYKFALQYITPGSKVLDAPCGSGYGARLFAENKASIFGVDIDKETIEHAKKFFSSSFNSFFAGNMENLRKLFPEEKIFDFIISFEGIEHTKNPELFLTEARRLLKNEGCLIISTPRKPHGNPFHFKEYSLDEFKKELSVNFKIEKIFGQIYTDIFDLKKSSVNPYDYNRFNFIAICSLKN